MIQTMQLQRLAYLVRHAASKRMVDKLEGINISAFAEELGERLYVYLRAHIMGAQEKQEVDCGPDGRWQMLRAVFGLPHRRKKRVFVAQALFPLLKTDRPNLEVVFNGHVEDPFLEVDDDPA